jgi:hypothetical protein
MRSDSLETAFNRERNMLIKIQETVLVKFREKGGSYHEYYIPPADINDEVACLDELGAQNIEIIDCSGNVIFENFGFVPVQDSHRDN